LLAALAFVSGCGATSPTSPEMALDSSPPPAPANLIVASGSTDLSWDPSAAADVAGYQVYEYSPDPSRDNAYVLLGEVDSGTTTHPLPVTVVDRQGFFRVRAVDTSGNRSALSNMVEVTLRAELAPGDVSELDPIQH
jgi:hypothetical protein